MAEVRNARGELQSVTPDAAARNRAESEAAVTLENAPSIGGKGKGGKTPMPKLADFSGDNAAWMTAVRKWRQESASDTDLTARKRGLERMSSR